MKLEHFKTSTFGSYEEVKKIQNCNHIWENKHGLVLDYIEVFQQCRECGTYKGKTLEQLRTELKEEGLLVSSLKVKEFDWGKIILEDGSEYRDACIYPGGAHEWDWTKHGTGHIEGIQPGDIKDILNISKPEPNTVILTTGFADRLTVSRRANELLRKKKVIIAETEKAIEAYNQACDNGETVAILIHSTC